MRSLWQRWRDPLHARLRARRATARPEFVRHLAAEVGGRRRTNWMPLRLALAAALTLAMLVAVSGVGAGVYQISAKKMVSAVSKVVSGSNSTRALAARDDDDDDDADDDQYEEERRQCKLAVYQAHAEFHALFPRPTPAYFVAHKAFHRWMEQALRLCEQIGRRPGD